MEAPTIPDSLSSLPEQATIAESVKPPQIGHWRRGTFYGWTSVIYGVVQSAEKLIAAYIHDKRGLHAFSETVETGAKYIVDKYRLEMSAQDVADGIDAQVAHAYESEAGFKPGAEKLLNTLKDQNIPMTVATSTRRHLIEMAFERLGIMDCFVGIFTAPEVGKTKDEPAAAIRITSGQYSTGSH